MNKTKKSKKRIKRTLPSRFILYEKDFEIIQPKTAKEQPEIAK